MKALIFEDKVVQIEEIPFEVAPALTWVDCDENCQVGWIYNNGVLEPEPVPPKTIEELVGSIYPELLRTTIDEAAQQKNYDNAACCATYANSTNLTWKAEAEAFIAWRDACWEYAITLFAEIENEQTPDPGTEGFINNLPVLNW